MCGVSIWNCLQNWDASLEKAAQDQADSCFFKEEAATNIFYNTTELNDGPSEVVTDIVSQWLSGSIQQVRISSLSLLKEGIFIRD